MKIENVPISSVLPNKKNPRVIKDEKFKKLVKSIQDFPEMLKLRPIVVNSKMEVLGGNMRLKACQELKLKKVYIIKDSELTPDQQKEFIIKDNVGYGDWDWAMLGSDFNVDKLDEWGLPLIDVNTNISLDEFFDTVDDKPSKNKITLEYTEKDYKKVIAAFKKHSDTKEEVVFKLLGL